ncbi:hypothetical protein GE09DRAFT_82328 [Coniochaeta sp. 2T2.1]|nr:hypothetical protein GE09DRAFT_82328 [Coniochaeta sp. 2T2.1]
MLLTSSQVSIAVSSSVVVVFTAALFLSGYAIQQRTLRDLREAIKPSPRPKPQIFLPDRFKSTTTELEDGTVIVVDIPPGPDAYRPPRPDGEQVVVEVRPTVAGGDVTQRVTEGRKGDTVEVLREGKSERLQPGSQQELRDSKKDEGKKRESDSQKKEDKGKAKRPKKLSRAERRRQIKEELQKMSQGDRRGLWQPRLW